MALEWVMGSLVLILTALIGTLFKMALDNKGRLSKHDILFATLSEGLKKIDDISDNISDRFDKHEEKEDKVFNDVRNKLERLTISVALLKKFYPRDKENG